MSEESGGNSAEAPVEQLTPGRLLRRERERRALSVQQAAEDLHLDAWMVEALEADRFAALGAPVYAKGHLRKYATLLGMSPADVIQRYEALSDTPVVVDPIPASVAEPAQRPRPSLKVPLLIFAALVAIVIAVWLYRELSAPVEVLVPAPMTPTEEPAPAETPQAAEIGGAPPPQEVPSVATSAPVATANAPRSVAESERVQPEPAASVATNATPVRLRLEFNDSSWVEIIDATGRRLMVDTGAPGHVRTLSGVPPIKVTIGLASAVDLQVNDRPTEVPRRPGRDHARFVIEADGVAR